MNLKIFNYLLGMTMLGFAVYYSWHGIYDHATYNLVLGIWILE